MDNKMNDEVVEVMAKDLEQLTDSEVECQIVVNKIKCCGCGLIREPHRNNRHLCSDCVKANQTRISAIRYRNDYWQDIAKEASLELWERQPAETDWEWSIWTAYRDLYPVDKPTYRKAAEKLGTTVEVVKTIAGRWDFSVRMQEWVLHCDKLTLQTRQQEIVDMNKKHVDMAKKLNEKLYEAIQRIDPETLKPSELGQLMKMATDLERKARIDGAQVERETSVVKTGMGNADVAGGGSGSTVTKKEDLKEVVDILTRAGVLGQGSKVGIRQTTTTEVVSVDD